MAPKQHLSLLVQFVAAWGIFWVAGWPDYYQQYSAAFVGSGSVLLSVLFSLYGLYVLLRTKPDRQMTIALWYSFYFTVPLMALDTLYCGIYLGLGPVYLLKYWYLSVFYVSPWLTFVPTVWILRRGMPVVRS